MATILVIEGEQKISELLRSMLSSQGHEVLVAISGVEGLRLFRERSPRFTLLDFQTPDMDGLHVLAEIRKADPFASVIMLDGGMPGALRVEAWKLGALDFTQKKLSLTSQSSQQTTDWMRLRPLAPKFSSLPARAAKVTMPRLPKKTAIV